MKLVLFYAPISCSLVPYIALTEAKAEFAVEVVDFRHGGHMTPEFLQINPKHQIPSSGASVGRSSSRSICLRL